MSNVCDLTRPDIPCAVTTTYNPWPLILFTLFVTALAVIGAIVVIRVTRKK